MRNPSTQLPLLWTVLYSVFMVACSHSPASKQESSPLRFPNEAHFNQIRQLTHGGTNAEAYWSFDGKTLSFQHSGQFIGKFEGKPGPACDQIYSMNATDGSNLKMLSNGKGRTTCAFFEPGDQRVVFSSTFATLEACPPPPDMSKGYVWPVFPSYMIYSVKPDGSDLVPFEPGAPRAYNAEATFCADGSVVFTSDRDGDLDLFTGKIDHFGTLADVKRITHTLGYDGGAVFSPDCKQIAWRASRPREGVSTKGESEADQYRRLLGDHLIKPGELEIWVANVDGTHAHQVTRTAVASFAPAFTPDGKSVLFAANPRDPRGRKFDLYMIHTDGTRLERVTYSDTFDSFPMFSPDGKSLAFSSNRNATTAHETNVFVADWAETPMRTLSITNENPADRFAATAEKLKAPEMNEATTRAFLIEQFKSLGLSEPVNNVLGKLGKYCGKKKNPIVIGATMEPSAMAALLEVARNLTQSKELNQHACYVFAELTPEFVPFLKTQKTKPKAILLLGRVDKMENNHLKIFESTGSTAAKKWVMTTETVCMKARLDCGEKGREQKPEIAVALSKLGVPTLHFSADSGTQFNATGAIQSAEVVAEIAIQAAKK
ncbi:hypothetical protein WDW37_05015 [Bdellovibrionota bacterium FG-1]